MTVTTEPRIDGRRMRRQNNRELVLDALAALFAEGDYSPGAARIAARAGLSPRSLFRYFKDVDELHQAAIEREMQRARPLLQAPASGGTVDERVAALVSARSALFEAIAPAARAARASGYRYENVRRMMSQDRAALRKQVRAALGADAAKSEDVLAAADVICSFEAWELLRFDQRLSKARAVAVMSSALGMLVAGGAPTGGDRSSGRRSGR